MALTQENKIEQKYDASSDNLWNIADKFRELVCTELRNLDNFERIALKGDYLFKIDSFPRFIVMVDEDAAWSISMKTNLTEDEQSFCIDYDCPWVVTDEQISNVIDGSSRATILTDSVTLYKLLTGNLRAHKAFVTGKVTIAGDLAAFLKMVSLLKKGGVKSKYESTFQA